MKNDGNFRDQEFLVVFCSLHFISYQLVIDKNDMGFESLSLRWIACNAMQKTEKH